MSQIPSHFCLAEDFISFACVRVFLPLCSLLPWQYIECFLICWCCHLNVLLILPSVLIQPLWWLCWAPSATARLESGVHFYSAVCGLWEERPQCRGMLHCTSGPTMTSPQVVNGTEAKWPAAREKHGYWQRSVCLLQGLMQNKHFQSVAAWVRDAIIS